MRAHHLSLEVGAGESELVVEPERRAELLGVTAHALEQLPPALRQEGRVIGVGLPEGAGRRKVEDQEIVRATTREALHLPPQSPRLERRAAPPPHRGREEGRVRALELLAEAHGVDPRQNSTSSFVSAFRTAMAATGQLAAASMTASDVAEPGSEAVDRPSAVSVNASGAIARHIALPTQRSKSTVTRRRAFTGAPTTRLELVDTLDHVLALVEPDLVDRDRERQCRKARQQTP